MIGADFDVLTPLAKLHRISRQIEDMDTFKTRPGLWIDRNSLGRMVQAGDPSGVRIYGLCLTSAEPHSYDYDGITSYIANDTRVGRITTLEQPGIRSLFGPAYFVRPPIIGDLVYVIDNDATGETNGIMTATPPTTGETAIAVGKCTSIDGDSYEIMTIEQREVVGT